MDFEQREQEYKDTIARLQEENSRLKSELEAATRTKKADATEELANHLLSKYGVKNQGETIK